MTKDEILTQIQKVLESEFDIEKKKVVPEALLAEDLELDSIDIFDLISYIEKWVAKPVFPESFSSIRTIGEIVDIIDKMVNQPDAVER